MNHYSPKDMLEVMLSHLGISAEVVEEMRPSGPTLHIVDEEASFLIGENGHTLDDLQYLLNRMLVSEENEQTRVAVDIAGYRLNEQVRFLEKVREVVETVRTTGEEVVLDPMNSYERMMVHNAFKEDAEIQTSSPSGPERTKQITVRRVS
ncbi:MAG: R3H domain-containing nucleic acid-binding protein [Verrucomicrobiota bacterium]